MRHSGAARGSRPARQKCFDDMAGKIEYMAPIENASGKIFGLKNRWTAVKRSFGQRMKGCAFTSSRNLVTHPYADYELLQQRLFKKMAQNVAARRKTKSPSYQSDLAAFKASDYETFQKWLWADEKKKYETLGDNYFTVEVAPSH